MTADRLAEVRSLLAREGLAGYVQPHEDEYLGEFVPPHAERLAWLTGFTGSAGTAVVLRDRAALFVDGRYTLQAADEVDPDAFKVRNVADTAPETWIGENLGSGEALGYDPRLVSVARARALRRAAEKAGGSLAPLDAGPVDRCWRDRPRAPAGRIVAHGIEVAGQPGVEKRETLAARLRDGALGAVVIWAPDSVAWLFNLRGSDLPYTPVARASAVLSADGTATLFAESDRVGDEVLRHLGDGVALADPGAVRGTLAALGARGARVGVDPHATPAWVAEALDKAGAEVVERTDPVVRPRAVKNPVELEGMRAAHRADGRAVVRFLRWLEEAVPGGGVTESGAAERLEAFRRQEPSFRGPSFPTISGAGPNGAVVHYRPRPGADRRLAPDALYLVDSGGQYPAGTTDITRTVAFGRPAGEMRDRFTRVLKGHVALARARFPRGTTGGQLDALARAPLWEAGLDFDHGTGHGVGSFLNVHEGPHGIAFRVLPGDPPRASRAALVALEPGMVVSNEPGYYRAGHYGIRIENLVAVEEAGRPAGGEVDLLGFETLTLAPVDRRLIDAALLDRTEAAWLDSYHRRVLATLAPGLPGPDAAWLEAACAPIAD